MFLKKTSTLMQSSYCTGISLSVFKGLSICCCVLSEIGALGGQEHGILLQTCLVLSVARILAL